MMPTLMSPLTIIKSFKPILGPSDLPRLHKIQEKVCEGFAVVYTATRKLFYKHGLIYEKIGLEGF